MASACKRYLQLNESNCFLQMHDWPRLLVLQEFPTKLSHENVALARTSRTMDFSRHVLPAGDVSFLWARATCQLIPGYPR